MTRLRLISGSERFDRLRDVLERDGPNPIAEPEHVRAGIDHIEMVESQIIDRGGDDNYSRSDFRPVRSASTRYCLLATSACSAYA